MAPAQKSECRQSDIKHNIILDRNDYEHIFAESEIFDKKYLYTIINCKYFNEIVEDFEKKYETCLTTILYYVSDVMRIESLDVNDIKHIYKPIKIVKSPDMYDIKYKLTK